MCTIYSCKDKFEVEILRTHFNGMDTKIHDVYLYFGLGLDGVDENGLM